MTCADIISEYTDKKAEHGSPEKSLTESEKVNSRSLSFEVGLTCVRVWTLSHAR